MDNYTTWVGIFGAIGLLLALRKCNTLAQGLAILQACILASIAAIMAGRLGFILLHFDYFQDHLHESIKLMQTPGLSEHAALLAGGWAGWRYLRPRQPDQFWGLACIVMWVGIGASLGCIEAGCGYGLEVWPTDHALAWAISVDWPDAYTISNPRLPTQIMLALWLLINVCSFHAIGPSVCDTGADSVKSTNPFIILKPLIGQFSWLLWFATGDLVIQFMRADPAPMLWYLRAPQCLDITIIGVLLLYCIKKAIR